MMDCVAVLVGNISQVVALQNRPCGDKESFTAADLERQRKVSVKSLDCTLMRPPKSQPVLKPLRPETS